MKKTLNREEEFQIMKIVLDKFMWLALVVIGYGFYKMITYGPVYGLIIIVCGAFLMLVFMWMIIKEYNYMK